MIGLSVSTYVRLSRPHETKCAIFLIGITVTTLYSINMEFTCPYCNHPTTITNPNIFEDDRVFDIVKERMTYDERIGIDYVAIACPNAQCKQVTFNLAMRKYPIDQRGNRMKGEKIMEWGLMPESSAKPQPDYIPSAIVEDYTEACRIKTLSPKASAALSRRCLQGMIRDFWGINKRTLKLEIDELEAKVPSDVWEAIDAVRSVGNIGAHMEKDVNLIIEIEPEEADMLIGLIEDLFIDWYVTKYEREVRQGALKLLAQEKQAARANPAATSDQADTDPVE